MVYRRVLEKIIDYIIYPKIKKNSSFIYNSYSYVTDLEWRFVAPTALMGIFKNIVTTKELLFATKIKNGNSFQ